MSDVKAVELKLQPTFGPLFKVYEEISDRGINPAVWIRLSRQGINASVALSLDQAQQVRDAIDACIRAQRGEA